MMFWAAIEAQVERDRAHARIRWLEARIKVLEAGSARPEGAELAPAHDAEYRDASEAWYRSMMREKMRPFGHRDWANQPAMVVLTPQVLDAVIEWRDAREAIFRAGESADAKSMPPLFAALAAAEHKLMALVRMIPGGK